MLFILKGPQGPPGVPGGPGPVGQPVSDGPKSKLNTLFWTYARYVYLNRYVTIYSTQLIDNLEPFVSLKGLPGELGFPGKPGEPGKPVSSICNPEKVWFFS